MHRGLHVKSSTLRLYEQLKEGEQEIQGLGAFTNNIRMKQLEIDSDEEQEEELSWMTNHLRGIYNRQRKDPR